MVRRPSRRGSCFATILPPASPPPGPTSRRRPAMIRANSPLPGLELERRAHERAFGGGGNRDPHPRSLGPAAPRAAAELHQPVRSLYARTMESHRGGAWLDLDAVLSGPRVLAGDHLCELRA